MEQTAITDDSVESSFFEDAQSVPNTHIKTRVFSFVALAAVVIGCGAIVREGYYVVTDSFVAPAILSADNDLVLDQKIKLEQILLEKGKAQSALAEADADLEAGKQAVDQLNDLKKTAKKALVWTNTTTSQQFQVGTKDIHTLADQKEELLVMYNRQNDMTVEARKNLEVGLIQKPDYLKEIQNLNQIQVAIFENDRSRMQSELLLGQAAMSQQALHAAGGAMPMPEQIMSADELVKIECQILQTEAEIRTQTATKIQVQEELNKIAQLEGELRARPVFKAIDQNVDLAFAPYSALHDISPGSRLMSCVWGVFNCKEVGTVSAIVPGETILPDIFGSGQSRGQFITVNLNKIDRDESMQSKVLRVRGGNTATTDAKTVLNK